MVLVSKPKHHRAKPGGKQRQGKHHKHSDPYLKTYWPYLPITLIVTLGLALSGFWGHASKSVLGYATDVSISELLQDTNDQRAANGLPPLAVNSLLNNAAQAKANDMATRDYWSHNTPEGNPPWIFFTNAGYNYQTAGENLAYGFDTSSNAVAGWMASPGHKANILNTSYVDVGFGFANSSNYQGTGPETVIVAEYGSPQAVAASQPAAPAATTPTSSKPLAQLPPTSTDTPQPAAEPESKPVETNATPVAANEQKTAPKPTPIDTKNVSRLQLFASSNATWSTFAVSALATVAVCIFFLRHALFWHRALVKGENFFIRHKLLDIGLVLVAVAGFVLTRSAGVIH